MCLNQMNKLGCKTAVRQASQLIGQLASKAVAAHDARGMVESWRNGWLQRRNAGPRANVTERPHRSVLLVRAVVDVVAELFAVALFASFAAAAVALCLLRVGSSKCSTLAPLSGDTMK